MHMRRYARAAVAGAGLAALAPPRPPLRRARKQIEPLNQYVVSGKVDTEELARAGFDLTEARVKGRSAGFAIVATPSQAAELQARTRRCARSRACAHRRRASRRPARSPTRRTATTSSGPWSLKPAPCPTTCATPLVPLKDLVPRSRAAQPDVVKEDVIGKQRARPGRSWPTRSPRTRATSATAAARPCSTTPRSTRASGSPPRSSAGSSSTSSQNKNQTGGLEIKRLLADARAVVRPDRQPRRLRLHLHRRRPRACGARTCATTTATARSPTSTASTPTATGRRSGTTTSRARRTTRPRDLPRLRPGVGARGQGAARAR